jgi:hypothetical protein
MRDMLWDCADIVQVTFRLEPDPVGIRHLRLVLEDQEENSQAVEPAISAAV